MSSLINAVGSGGSSGFDTSKMATLMASKMMSDLDPNDTGKVTKDQFVSALKSKGVSEADATKMYGSIDTKDTGSITKSDIETAIKNGNLKPPSGGSRGSPGGAGASAGTGQAGGSATTSTKTYDKEDLNQDGTVTATEELVYELKHPAVASSDNKTSTQKPGSNVDVKA
ncbi:MAG: EF-hand domain-containing protein [Betaproteobacteria bacterium]